MTARLGQMSGLRLLAETRFQPALIESLAMSDALVRAHELACHANAHETVSVYDRVV